MKHSKRSPGYTLIELMVVIAIIGLISSWAIPTYFGYVLDARRSDAISSMNRMLAQQELFYGNNQSSYTSFVASLGYDDGLGNSIAPSENGHYTIAIGGCRIPADFTDCVELTSAPAIGSSQIKDEECLSIAINSKGRQTATNPECWN